MLLNLQPYFKCLKENCSIKNVSSTISCPSITVHKKHQLGTKNKNKHLDSYTGNKIVRNKALLVFNEQSAKIINL